MNNKKKIILGSIIGIMIGLLISTTYAIFSYSKMGNNQELIAGDIYMHYNESNTLTLENALPSSTYDETKYFEFTIKGKNTNTKYNIVYDINLNYGDEIENKIRIQDRFLKFRLVEVVNNEEQELLTDKSYLSIDNKRIYVSTINKETNTEITKTYRLYVWIDKSVIIGNTDYSDYTMTDWNNVYGSVKVSVTGDFSEKEVETEPYLVMKNLYSSGGTAWTNIRGKITSVEFHDDGIIPDNVINTIDVTDASSAGDVYLYTVDDGLGNNTYKAVVVGDDVIYAPENSQRLFRNMSNLFTFNSKNFKVDNTTNIMQFFQNDVSLVNIDSLSTWNTSKVTDSGGMAVFQNCSSIRNIDALSNWDTSKMTGLYQMFDNCTSLENINGLSNWDVSNVTGLSYMFINCTSLSDVSGLKNWNVEKVKMMYQMFRNCPNIEVVDLSNWKTTSLTNMYQMFGMFHDDGTLRYDSKLKRIILSDKFDSSNVTDMTQLFANNTMIEDYSFLQYLDTGSVQNMTGMFQYNHGLTGSDLQYLENWDVSSATYMMRMFSSCQNIADASALNNWNINPSASFSEMFSGVPSHPEFTKVAGTWDSQGTFTPTA